MMIPNEVLRLVKVTLDSGQSGHVTNVSANIIIRELERHGWVIVRKDES